MSQGGRFRDGPEGVGAPPDPRLVTPLIVLWLLRLNDDSELRTSLCGVKLLRFRMEPGFGPAADDPRPSPPLVETLLGDVKEEVSGGRTFRWLWDLEEARDTFC